jgi:O-glycosyl hydrolase
MSEFYHYRTNDEVEMQVLLPGYKDCALAFTGREETETVTCHLYDYEKQARIKPVFECKKDHFELFFEQASGALMNANGDYPQSPNHD